MVIFVIGLVAMILIASLAFDVGQMLLDRRTQQDAADAAALAGARYLVASGCQPNSTEAKCPAAVAEALRVANRNGFGSTTNRAPGANGTIVTVNIPPSEGDFVQKSGFVEVRINSNHGSVFRSIIGIVTDPVAARGVAANRDGIAADVSMLALHPDACASGFFEGNGTVTVQGGIQINSTCKKDAFKAGGQTEVTVEGGGAINVVGGSTYKIGNVIPEPTTVTQVMADPFKDLPPPGVPNAPTNMKQVPGGSMPTPDGCPGGPNPATAKDPKLCQFTSNYAGTVWDMYEGYYPGGLKVQGGTFFMHPGIYYIGGGGLEFNGTQASLYTVSYDWNLDYPLNPYAPNPYTPLGCTKTAPGECPYQGGVMIYNTNDGTLAPIGPIVLNGSSSEIHLVPMYGDAAAPYAGIIVFQDRLLGVGDVNQADIKITGNGANLSVVGLIYEPLGDVVITGNAGTIGTSQIIASTFKVTGGGVLGVDYNTSLLPQLSGVGLWE
jgi:hypothetical protein